MINLWLSNVPPSSSTISLSKMHPQLKVEFRTVMNPIKEVRFVWKIQCSIDQPVSGGVLPHREKTGDHGRCHCLQLGFCLDWRMAARIQARVFCVRFFNFLGILQNQILGPLELLVICWNCWKTTIKSYKSKTYHITIFNITSLIWWMEGERWEVQWDRLYWWRVYGWLYWWMGFPTATTLPLEGLHCYVQSASYQLSPPPTVAAGPCQLPVFQAAFAHTMQGDCRGRAPPWNLCFNICFFRCFIGVKGDLGTEISDICPWTNV